MERHPFTTQTFIPIGLCPADPDTAYLVIVAPPLLDVSGNDIPDIDKIKVFLATGSQAVTYGMGIWHAPMIVIGAKPVSFVVTQFVNGVPSDDCQEVELSTENEVVTVQIRASGLHEAAKL